MLIIIEGVNGSGKSTLSKHLSSVFNLRIHHPGPKPLTDDIAIAQCISQDSIYNAILDRATCISRQVYGDHNEDPEGLDPTHLAIMNLFLSRLIKKDTIFIHTVGKGEHQLKDYYSEEHIKNIVAKHDELRGRYDKLFERVPHMRYDFETHTFQEVVEHVYSCVRELESIFGNVPRRSQW